MIFRQIRLLPYLCSITLLVFHSERPRCNHAKPCFRFKTPRCNPAKPYFQSERPFRNLRNLVSFSKHPFAPSDTLFQFQNPLLQPATGIFKTVSLYCNIASAVFKIDLEGKKPRPHSCSRGWDCCWLLLFCQCVGLAVPIEGHLRAVDSECCTAAVLASGQALQLLDAAAAVGVGVLAGHRLLVATQHGVD